MEAGKRTAPRNLTPVTEIGLRKTTDLLATAEQLILEDVLMLAGIAAVIGISRLVNKSLGVRLMWTKVMFVAGF